MTNTKDTKNDKDVSKDITSQQLGKKLQANAEEIRDAEEVPGAALHAIKVQVAGDAGIDSNSLNGNPKRRSRNYSGVDEPQPE